jgi:hypothetical protein
MVAGFFQNGPYFEILFKDLIFPMNASKTDLSQIFTLKWLKNLVLSWERREKCYFYMEPKFYFSGRIFAESGRIILKGLGNTIIAL